MDKANEGELKHFKNAIYNWSNEMKKQTGKLNNK